MTHQQKLYEIKMGLRPKECVPKPKKPIAKQSAKKRLEIVEQKESGDSELDKYFEYHMKHSYPKCDNCGLVAEWLLEEKHRTTWMACQAHVLEKKNSIGGFPSVAANLENHLVLFPHFKGLCNCHGEFDSTEEKMAKMKVFPKAVEIVNRLYPFIAAAEKKYLPEVFVQEIKPQIFNP